MGERGLDDDGARIEQRNSGGSDRLRRHSDPRPPRQAGRCRTAATHRRSRRTRESPADAPSASQFPASVVTQQRRCRWSPHLERYCRPVRSRDGGVRLWQARIENSISGSIQNGGADVDVRPRVTNLHLMVPALRKILASEIHPVLWRSICRPSLHRKLCRCVKRKRHEVLGDPASCDLSSPTSSCSLRRAVLTPGVQLVDDRRRSRRGNRSVGYFMAIPTDRSCNRRQRCADVAHTPANGCDSIFGSVDGQPGQLVRSGSKNGRVSRGSSGSMVESQITAQARWSSAARRARGQGARFL